MTIVSQIIDFVIGVDTHAKTHTFAVTAASGQALAQRPFPVTSAGFTRAQEWVARITSNDPSLLWVVEGASTYGATLVESLHQAGHLVVEAPPVPKGLRAGKGKSDPIDAALIAAATLPLDVSRLRHPRSDNGVRATIQVLITARDQMNTQRTAAVNALTALLRIVGLGVDARSKLSLTQIRHVAAWRTRDEGTYLMIARAQAVRLAKQITSLHTQLDTNEKLIKQLVTLSPAAGLLDMKGIGPITAAVAFTVWSHHGRVRSEAAFASIAGVNPLPASSGNTTRHRLNRGGDRRLNHALHMATVTRMRVHPETIAYVARRKAEGLTKPEIRRCLKRYLARHIYRALNAAAAATI